jgi:hypothetical protein
LRLRAGPQLQRSRGRFGCLKPTVETTPSRPAGSFEQFLDHLPHVVKDVRNGRTFFQIRPDPPQ